MGTKAEIEIGAMTRADLDQVFAIEQASFSMPWSRNLFEQELRKPAVSTMLVAYQRRGPGRRILGYIVFWGVADEMHILNLAVAPGERRKGIGKMLVLAGLRQARDRGARIAYLEVRASNKEALKLYRDLGFIGGGLRRNYYEMPPEDAVVMFLSEGAFQALIESRGPR